MPRTNATQKLHLELLESRDLLSGVNFGIAEGQGFPPQFQQAATLPDLSGLTWIGDELLLAVHDAKNPGEKDRPRVSLLTLPQDLDGILWDPMELDWPEPLGPSNDLESVAGIPGTSDVLLVESGDNGSEFQRIFRAHFDGQRLSIQDDTHWPVAVNNVEATAVAKLGDKFVFLYAERAENQPSTLINWAEFSPSTLEFGPFTSVVFDNPDPDRINRPVVAMDVDSDGTIYVASAFDAEAAGYSNPDNGPFASSVWSIGDVTLVADHPQVTLFAPPRREATLDGLKVESVALRDDGSGTYEIFVGVDDENYGGTLRMLPPTGSFHG